MGIDGIGKRPPPAPAVGSETADRAGGTSGATKAGETSFQVPAASTNAASATQQAHGVEGVDPSPLARVRSGDISVNQYLDMKVDEATAHLGALAPSQRSMIKDALRSQMATDPALSDLVQQATGHLPEPSES